MKLENAARCIELLASIDDLGRSMLADDSCACAKLAGALLERNSVALAAALSPLMFGHASPEDLDALQALTAQLREQAVGGDPG